jgi:hypothetical protein
MVLMTRSALYNHVPVPEKTLLRGRMSLVVTLARAAVLELAARTLRDLGADPV